MKKQLIKVIAVVAVLNGLSSVRASIPDVAHFTKIRMEYAQREDFNSNWNLHHTRKKIASLWNDGKNDESMKLAKQWLEKHPVDTEMHLWYAFRLREKGDIQGYFKHRHLYQGFLASIMASGSGLSVDSPVKVISVSEEYAVLRALDAKLITQSLIRSKSGIRCDKMDCKIGGKAVTLYFDVSIPMGHMNKILRSKGQR